MAATAVLALAGLLAGSGAVASVRWAGRTVDDPGRYRTAVAPLAGDRRFHALAGATTSLRMRSRVG